LHFKPKNPGRPKKRGEVLTKAIRISPELFEILNLERRKGETFNEVILRDRRTKASQIQELRKEIDQLMEVRNPPPPPTPAAEPSFIYFSLTEITYSRR
jgi:hypothetical protein